MLKKSNLIRYLDNSARLFYSAVRYHALLIDFTLSE